MTLWRFGNMVGGCPASSDGEHYGIEGVLLKHSIKGESVFAHYVGCCEYCGCPIHFTTRLVPDSQFDVDTPREVHFEGYKEVYE